MKCSALCGCLCGRFRAPVGATASPSRTGPRPRDIHLAAASGDLVIDLAVGARLCSLLLPLAVRQRDEALLWQIVGGVGAASGQACIFAGTARKLLNAGPADLDVPGLPER